MSSPAATDNPVRAARVKGQQRGSRKPPDRLAFCHQLRMAQRIQAITDNVVDSYGTIAAQRGCMSNVINVYNDVFSAWKEIQKFRVNSRIAPALVPSNARRVTTARSFIDRMAMLHGYIEQMRQYSSSHLTAINKSRPAGMSTSSDMLKDFAQMEEEFYEFRIDLRNWKISATIPDPIVLEGVYLGEFRIVLNLKSMRDGNFEPTAFKIVAVNPHPAWGRPEITHPHVSSEELCAGDAKLPVKNALRQGRILDAFLLIKSVLQTYNSGSPHVKLSAWEGQPCHECGERGDEDYPEPEKCNNCRQMYCSNCSETCDVCDRTCCCSCMCKCETCDKEVCPSCIKINDIDQKEICAGCSTTCDNCSKTVDNAHFDTDHGMCDSCVDDLPDEDADDEDADDEDADTADNEENMSKCECDCEQCRRGRGDTVLATSLLTPTERSPYAPGTSRSNDSVDAVSFSIRDLTGITDSLRRITQQLNSGNADPGRVRGVASRDEHDQLVAEVYGSPPDIFEQLRNSPDVE